MPYAEVIVPLPLYGTFTYSIPDGMLGRVAVGHRVVVQFGARRFYTGIVSALTPVAPAGFDIKPIAALLDDAPVLRHPQLKLWSWMADYYLCTTGDVLKAALPAGLRVESETVVEAVAPNQLPDDGETASPMSEREAIVLQAVDHGGRISVAELTRQTGLNGVEAIVARLVERGHVSVSERLVERYRTKTVRTLRLAVDRSDSTQMERLWQQVRRSPAQEQLMVALIDRLNKLRTEGLPEQVERSGLLAQVPEATSAHLRALVKKGLIEESVRQVNRFSLEPGITPSELPQLSEAQGRALDAIHRGLKERDVMLLHGVTSSGKTEIYIHLIDYVLRSGNQALFLVPEIALTTQLTTRLQRVFGRKVVIYHSKFTDDERVDIWRRLLADPSPCVVIGARSALFLPFGRLGIVIVDEEHESSYKQFDPAPRYNARDCAMVLASMHGAKTVLGSATPSVETYYKARTGRYGLVELAERYGQVQMPAIEVVDTVQARRRSEMAGPLTSRLTLLTRNAIGDGRQAILFHNRRGFAPVVVCRQCGYVPKCEQCDVSMTYHRRADEMVCHYCGSTRKLPGVCPSCREPAIEAYGYGTERIEDIADSAFPEARIMRMDLDTTRNKDGYQDIINGFSRGDAQILVGTQMVTKGLDFDRVAVVGVLNADTLINFPDFRASERAFNMLEQVAGRAGRRDTRGTVVVQTSMPSHPVIEFLRGHDYEGFYTHELEERRRYNYPPFTRVINIYLKHADLPTVAEVSARYAATLRQLFGNRVFGPEEPHVGRIQRLYIRKIMLKIEIEASMKKVKKILRDVFEQYVSDRRLRALTVYYDVDPM